MSRINIVIGLFLVVGMYSCDSPDVSFLEAQPSDLRKTEKFSGKFRGSYLSVSDSCILKISKHGITQNWDFIVEVDASESAKDVAKNISISINDGDLEIVPLEDSLSYHVMYTQNLFSFSNNEILKFNDGVYFLNFKESRSSWNVKTLRFDDQGRLELQNLDLSPSDVEKLKTFVEVKEISNNEGSSTAYFMEPNMDEFMNIINSNLLGDAELYKPIK